MSMYTAARGQGERPSASELQEVLEGFIEYAEVNGLPKQQVDRIRAALAALEFEEVVAEGYTTHDAEVCMKQYGQFTVWSKRIDKVNRRVRILAVKGE